MAIETIGNLKYTVETDYWSYGVLLWELFTVLNKDYPGSKVLPYDGIQNDQVCLADKFIFHILLCSIIAHQM